MCITNARNRKARKLDKYLHKTVTVVLTDGSEYTGILIPRRPKTKQEKKFWPDSYYIIYEEDDSERVQCFYYYQLSELWSIEKGQMKKVFSVIKDD